ncbi:aldehyde-activating protein [Sphingomonas sp. Leaf357]|nr:aldehyde-activating protein [Sphingomonas sp. Leaf357]
MTVREATCRCGQLRATCSGDPVRVSVCHCLACQKRSGSAFAAQARWPDDRVQLSGAFEEWSQAGGSGSRATFRFCATCSATIAFVNESLPGTIAIPLGAFADPTFPPPQFSVYEERKHPWLAVLGAGVEHFD